MGAPTSTTTRPSWRPAVQSRIRTLNGVSQIYAGRLQIPAPVPNNRFGINANASGSIPAYILGTSTTGTG